MRKVCNNKVEFSANGKSAIFRLSDMELYWLRIYDDKKPDNETKAKLGLLYNFSVFAFFDYQVKGSKCRRFKSIFNYHEFEKMKWTLIEDDKC